MENEERHAVGSAPALGGGGSGGALLLSSLAAAESPKTAARSLFDGSKPIPTSTTAAMATPATTADLAAPLPPSLSHLPAPTKEGSFRGGTHHYVDRSSLHASAERQSLSREGSRHGPGSREGSRHGPGGGAGGGRRTAAAAAVVMLPGDHVEGDSAAASPETSASNPCFPPLNVRGEEIEEAEDEEEVDGDALFLRQLERLRVSRRRSDGEEGEPEIAAAASPASPPPPPPPPPPPQPRPLFQLGAPRPVFYDFLVATGGSPPAPRWGHAAAAFGADTLVIVGGVGAAVFEDVHVFDALSGSWHEVRTKGPPVQRQSQQQGLTRVESNGSSCGTPSSSSNLSSPSSASSSSRPPLNFAARAAPLTASSAATTALFARRDAGPGPSFGAAAAEWPSGSGRVFVFGGRQGRGFLRSAHELDVTRGAWRNLRADSVADPRRGSGAEAAAAERPVAAAAGSAAASSSGGKKSAGGVGGGPPAVAGATLTSVGEHGLLLFGGAGKKVSGEVWLLRPRSLHGPTNSGGGGGEGSASGSGRSGRRAAGRGGAAARDDPSATSALYPPYSNDTWIKLDISPDPIEGTPRPRHGHAAFLGPCGTDSVVFFGGAASDGGALNDTWLLNLKTRAWSRPRHPAGSCAPPRARFSHCAALITHAAGAETGSNSTNDSKSALVFGGCTPEGTFLNDAHVLDLSTWSWSPAVAPAGPPPPPPRYGASATAVGGRLLLYGGSDARQPFGGVVSVVTDFGSDLNAVAGDLLVSSRENAAASPQRRSAAPAAAAVPAAEAAAEEEEDLPSSPSLSLAPLSPSFATPVAAPPLPTSSSPPATGGSMRSRLADALGRRSAQATAAAAARKAAVAEGLFRAERERAESLAAELAAARLLLGEERATLEEEARRAALGVSASARREAEAARRALAAAEGARADAERRAREAERRATEADRRTDVEAEARREQQQQQQQQQRLSASTTTSEDSSREEASDSLLNSLRARLRSAESGRAAAAREAVAARAAADAARRGAARARVEAVAEATAQSSASLALMEAEFSRLQAHARALEAALEGARKAALVAAAGGAGGSGNASSSSSSSTSALELQLSRYRGEPATLASLSPEELRSLEEELVRSARAAAAAAREADAASAAALRAALADREARLSSLTLRSSSPSSALGGGVSSTNANPPSSSTTECGICLEREVEVSLDCGHLLCSGCAEEQRRARKGRCPFCDAVSSGPPRRIFV